MSDAKKLSSMDATFLYLETSEMPMHVGSMAIFRLPDGYKGDLFEDFKATIASRLHILPVSISTHGLALNITVQSYRDQLDFGFVAGANIIPHVEVLCDTLPEGFDALEAAFAPPADLKSKAS